MYFFLQMLILIIFGTATLIQMKDHPYIMQTINETKNFYQQFNISV